jgi:hypothetical protein
MRPDWEAVVPGMVDALIKHPQVDPAGSCSSDGRSAA